MRAEAVSAAVADETGGLGVDAVVGDVPTPPPDREGGDEDCGPPLESMDELALVLAANGRWAVTGGGVEIDAEDAAVLFAKSATVAFVNLRTWVDSASQHGRFLSALQF